MSETVQYRGKLKEVHSDKLLEEQCKELMGNIKLESFYKSYSEALTDEYDDKYIVHDGKLYEILSKEYEDTDEDIFIANKISDDTYEYQVRYYNGGCGFSEAMEKALNMNNINEQE